MGGGDTTTTVKGDSDNIAAGGENVTINVRCSNGSKLSVQVSLDSTFGSFKSILSQPADIPDEQQRLIYKGRILKDDQTLKAMVWRQITQFILFEVLPAAASASAINALNPNANQDPPRDAVPLQGGHFSEPVELHSFLDLEVVVVHLELDFQILSGSSSS